jgi:hypothetical protein
MDDEDTARSGFGDQELCGVSKLNVPLRDPIDWFDPEVADVSIPLEALVVVLKLRLANDLHIISLLGNRD